MGWLLLVGVANISSTWAAPHLACQCRFRKERMFGILTFTESTKVVLHGSRCYLDFRLLPTKKYRFGGPKTIKNLDFRTLAPMFTKTGPGGLKSLVVGADGMNIFGR